MVKLRTYFCVIDDGVHPQFTLPLCRRHMKEEKLDSDVFIVKEVFDKDCFNCFINKKLGKLRDNH